MIDLHLHTTASDGRLAPGDLVSLAAAAGLTTIAVTDHDTVAGLATARHAAAELGLRLVAGIEVTAVEHGRDVHVLGYFFDSESAALAGFLRAQRSDRVRRVREMGERLRALGLAIDVEPLVRDAEARDRTIGRPQVADALADRGLVADRREAFDRLLAEGRPAFIPRRGPAVADVIRVISGAGGITSLAHPGLTGVDSEIARFAENGLDALEARHSDHDATVEARYRRMAEALGLAVSGGSDFHADPSQHIDTLGVVTLPAADFAELQSRAATRVQGNVAPRGGG